jgi:hypothetical protein
MKSVLFKDEKNMKRTAFFKNINVINDKAMKMIQTKRRLRRQEY